MSLDVEERLRHLEKDLAVTQSQLEALQKRQDNLSGGINRGLWILGGGFITAAVSWIVSGGLIK